MTKRKNSPGDSASPQKKKKYECKFNAKRSLEFRHIAKSDKGDLFAFCLACNSNFGVYNGGRNDVQRHCKSPGHISNDKSMSATPKLGQMFSVQEDPFSKKVTQAEILFAGFVAEHNLSFKIADHFSDLVPIMFPDSQIAKKFKCKSQKTANVITQALAPCCDDEISELCKKEKFSIMMDESNDRASDKCVAILVRVLDRTVKRVVTGFLSMPICNIGNAVNLFSCLEKVFIDRHLPWENLVGYASDKASVMVGKHNSVLSRIKEKQPGVYDLGCVCHVANTCLSYGLKKLPSAVEELLIDIYFHFLHSSKRKEEYKEFLEFTDTEPAKLLKHCPTRWLSLDRCVRRTLQQWPALHSYFNSHPESEKTSSRVYRCATNLSDDLLQLVYHFLEFILAPLLDFNTTFQADAAMIGYLHQEMTRLLRKFMGKFVTSAAINSSTNVAMVDFKNPDIQHPDENLAVGMNARRFLSENPDLPQQTVTGFFRIVREFYIEVTEKMIQKFPFKDKTLRSIGFVNPDLRQEIECESVVELSTLFNLNMSADELQEEFTDYQLSPSTELPEFIYGETELDSFWFAVADLKLPNGSKRYKLLPEVAFTVLSLPHSNADTERCFSTCRKIQTDCRGNLCNSTTSALLSVKLNTKCECFQVKPTEKVLKLAKSACTNYNKQLKET